MEILLGMVITGISLAGGAFAGWELCKRFYHRTPIPSVNEARYEVTEKDIRDAWSAIERFGVMDVYGSDSA